MKIYGASKTWHAPEWQRLRAAGYDLVSDWIDLDNDSDFVRYNKKGIWDMCLRDVTRADIVVLYCGDSSEEMRGAVMEAGHAIGQGKRVYCINDCETFRACDHSDVAFTYHDNWVWIRGNEHIAIDEGLARAIELEKANRTVINAFNQFRAA